MATKWGKYLPPMNVTHLTQNFTVAKLAIKVLLFGTPDTLQSSAYLSYDQSVDNSVNTSVILTCSSEALYKVCARYTNYITNFW